MRPFALAFALFVPLAAPAGDLGPGFVDSAPIRALVDDSGDIVEIHLEGAMLQAIANGKDDDPEGKRAKELFGRLKAVHAVIGNVKGSALSAFAVVQQIDQRLQAAGWQRVTRIKDETTLVSVLTHTTGEQIDGLVAMIFDAEEREIVFANLAGVIDLTQLGEIGDQLDVPGLDQVPGAR